MGGGLADSRLLSGASALVVALATACAPAQPAPPPPPPAEDRPATESPQPGAADEPGATPAQSPSLMLWGGVSATGTLHLDPAFVLDAPATPPPPPGPYRIEGIGDDGATLFSLDFEMGQMSEGGGGFVFMLPFREEWLGAADSATANDSTAAADHAAAADSTAAERAAGARPTGTAGPTLARIVLTGPEGSATLDRETRVPMAIVMDRATGRIRAILRGEDAEARIAALSETRTQPDAAPDDTRVVFSYGLPRPIPE